MWFEGFWILDLGFFFGISRIFGKFWYLRFHEFLNFEYFDSCNFSDFSSVSFSKFSTKLVDFQFSLDFTASRSHPDMQSPSSHPLFCMHFFFSVAEISLCSALCKDMLKPSSLLDDAKCDRTLFFCKGEKMRRKTGNGPLLFYLSRDWLTWLYCVK